MRTPTEPPGWVVKHSPRTWHEVRLSSRSPRQPGRGVGTIIPAERTSGPRTEGVRSFVQGHTAGRFWGRGPHSGTVNCECRLLLTRASRGKETHAHARTRLFKTNFRAGSQESAS